MITLPQGELGKAQRGPLSKERVNPEDDLDSSSESSDSKDQDDLGDDGDDGFADDETVNAIETDEYNAAVGGKDFSWLEDIPSNMGKLAVHGHCVAALKGAGDYHS